MYFQEFKKPIMGHSNCGNCSHFGDEKVAQFSSSDSKNMAAVATALDRFLGLLGPLEV